MEQMRVIFIFILMVSSAAEEEKNELTGIQGGSVTFPDPVLEFGFLIFGGKPLAMVKDRKFETLEDTYKDRLFWDGITGLFTFRGLQRNDSGVYIIDSKKGKVFTHHHKLTVYESVSTPTVMMLNMTAESCTFLCSGNITEETSLLWYRDKEILKEIRLNSSLPLTVHKNSLTLTYTCVAKNPAENKTATAVCMGPKDPDQNNKYRNNVIPFVLAAVVALVGLVIGYKMFQKKRAATETRGSGNRDSDVIYTDVHIADDIRTQQRNHQHLSAAEEHANLTTVYDKVQAHRISSPAAADC